MQWDVMPGHSRLIDNSGALKARRRPCQRRRRPRNRVAAKSSSAVTCLPRPFSSHAATVWAPAPTTDNIARSSTLRLSHIHTRNQSRSKWRVEIPRPMPVHAEVDAHRRTVADFETSRSWNWLGCDKSARTRASQQRSGRSRASARSFIFFMIELKCFRVPACLPATAL